MDWISVEDDLPKENQDVIYYFRHTGIHMGRFNRVEYPAEFVGEKGVFGNAFFGRDGFLVDDVTHWMPLPEPPNEGHDCPTNTQKCDHEWCKALDGTVYCWMCGKQK